ncbi:hypothetical protein LAZ67_1001056 [Cordylochernes scorpioides]|uniref:Uncharacterized protein n=1 Tax=Cordylochernes scorpioides TaxID=51811 RepID=A0ABY6JYD2_9ARAC|nr:hypothetical protein LAZ67_1001056 [Cordylochernes scorpioides]
MKGRRYATLDEIKTASKEKLKKILKKDFLKCFEDWKNRWHKMELESPDIIRVPRNYCKECMTSGVCLCKASAPFPSDESCKCRKSY